jgi:hypothetical protein
MLLLGPAADGRPGPARGDPARSAGLPAGPLAPRLPGEEPPRGFEVTWVSARVAALGRFLVTGLLTLAALALPLYLAAVVYFLVTIEFGHR